MPVDYYRRLGLSRYSTAEEIARAFRRLAFKLHPDRNPDQGAEQPFQEVLEAYDVLSNPDKRLEYDRQLAAAQRRRCSVSQRADSSRDPEQVFEELFSSAQATHEEIHAFEQLLDSFFAGDLGCRDLDLGLSSVDHRTTLPTPCAARTEAAASPGEEAEVELPLSLEELHSGCCREVRLKRRLPCCSPARAVAVQCSVPVLAGSHGGDRILCQGGVEAHPELGPVHFVIRERPHAAFQRRGDDLVALVPVPLLVALVGGQVGVPSLDGRRLWVAVPGVPSIGGGGSRQSGREGGGGRADGVESGGGWGPEDGCHTWGGGDWSWGVAGKGPEVVVEGEGMAVKGRPGVRGHLRVRLELVMPPALTDVQKRRLRAVLG